MSEEIDSFDPLANGAEGTKVPSDRLQRITLLAKSMVEQSAMVDQMEEDLKAAKAELHKLRTISLPEVMAECQMEDFTINGTKIIVENLVSGSLPKEPEKRAAAIQWLEANEAGGLIKTVVEVEFGKSQHNEAVAVFEDLKKAGHAVTTESSIHPQTLCAFVRERLDNGKPIDTELLGVFSGKICKIKAASKKKRSV